MEFAALTCTLPKEICRRFARSSSPVTRSWARWPAAQRQSCRLGSRAGVSWIGGVDGDCWYCHHGMENLCDHPTFTGYTVNGGYAEYALVRADFAFPLPEGLDDVHVAPLLCAGIIGFRSLRVAGVAPGERVGLYGFGSSASLAITVLQSWKCEVYVATRGENHRQRAVSLGATWVGKEDEMPPVKLDRAVTFAPSGKVVVSALSALRKGGVVAINAIHLDQMPAFDYDKLLWGERQIRSVANMTRQDARDFLAIAQQLKIRPQVAAFPLAGRKQGSVSGQRRNRAWVSGDCSLAEIVCVTNAGGGPLTGMKKRLCPFYSATTQWKRPPPLCHPD